MGPDYLGVGGAQGDVSGRAMTEPMFILRTGEQAFIRHIVQAVADEGLRLIIAFDDEGRSSVWSSAGSDHLAQADVGPVASVTVLALPAQTLALGNPGGRIDLLHPRTLKRVGGPMKAASTAGVSALAAVHTSVQNVLLAAGYVDGKVLLWDPANRRLRATLSGHTSGVSALTATVFADGRSVLVSGDVEGQIRLWDPTTGQQIGNPLPGHVGAVSALTIVRLPDGRSLLASCGADGMIRRWGGFRWLPTTLRQVGSALSGSAGVLAAVRLPSGRALLAANHADGGVRLWDPTTGETAGEPFDVEPSQVTALTAVGVRGRDALAAGSAGIIRLWDVSRQPTGGVSRPLASVPIAPRRGGRAGVSVEQRLRLLSPGARKLAELCSPAVRIQPELLRAVRLTCAPHLSAADESDIWWSGIVAGRSPVAIRMHPDVQRRLRETVAQQLNARPNQPVHTAWRVISEAHRDEPAAVRLEERIAWVHMTRGTEGLGEIDDDLNRALVSFVRYRRTEVAHWWPGAFARLPEAVGRTRAAQNLCLATAYVLGADAVTEFAGDGPVFDAELNAALRHIPDVEIGVLRQGAMLSIGEVDRALGAAILVPNTPVRLLELRWQPAAGFPYTLPIEWSAATPEHDRELRERIELWPGEVITRQIGTGPASLRTARGSVYELPLKADEQPILTRARPGQPYPSAPPTTARAPTSRCSPRSPSGSSCA